LTWIAPELRDAGLEVTDDQLDQATPSRSWAGVVDGPTFKRFARAWRLDDAERSPRTYVFDGMNWEAAGASPIVHVVVCVGDAPAESRATRESLPDPHKASPPHGEPPMRGPRLRRTGRQAVA
jgi:hypothetical protein